MKLTVLGILALTLGHFLLADVPAGFEDPEILKKVLKGEVLIEDKVSTNVEFVSVGKAFFKGTSPESYIKLAINYPVYPKMFDEVKEGELLKANPELTSIDFRLHLVFKVGPFSEDVYPEGHHAITYPVDAKSEGHVNMKITNYTDEIKSAEQNTRLIPYEGGMLVEDTVHVELQNASTTANIIKKKLKEFYSKYIVNLRKELKGEP